MHVRSRSEAEPSLNACTEKSKWRRAHDMHNAMSAFACDPDLQNLRIMPLETAPTLLSVPTWLDDGKRHNAMESTECRKPSSLAPYNVPTLFMRTLARRVQNTNLTHWLPRYGLCAFAGRMHVQNPIRMHGRRYKNTMEHFPDDVRCQNTTNVVGVLSTELHLRQTACWQNRQTPAP